jgi:tyrosine-protein phosphatase SIW14
MKRTWGLLAFSCFLPAHLFAQNHTQGAAQPATPAITQRPYGEKLKTDGIHNAGKISEFLFRGAQPKEEGFSELKKLGVTTIVDLRGENRHEIDWERSKAIAFGMRFVHIPVSGWSPPTSQQVVQFLSLFRDASKPKVFVHCRFGDDRTGVFVATYRMTFEKWSPEQAIEEMYLFGFNGFWHPAMKAFIRNFPASLQSNPAFAPFRISPALQ